MASWPGRWLLLFRLFGMHRCGDACVLACFVGLEAWLVAAALTDSMPMLRRLYNLSEYSRQAQREGGECEIETGRERQREGESQLALSAFGRLANTLSLGRSSRCLSGWVAICSIGRAPGCWQGPWPGCLQAYLPPSRLSFRPNELVCPSLLDLHKGRQRRDIH